MGRLLLLLLLLLLLDVVMYHHHSGWMRRHWTEIDHFGWTGRLSPPQMIEQRLTFIGQSSKIPLCFHSRLQRLVRPLLQLLRFLRSQSKVTSLYNTPTQSLYLSLSLSSVSSLELFQLERNAIINRSTSTQKQGLGLMRQHIFSSVSYFSKMQFFYN